MASECRAKNPATCRTHGMQTHQEASKDEAGKKEFFGSQAWEAVKGESAVQPSETVNKVVDQAFHDIQGLTGAPSETGNQKLAELLTDPDIDSVQTVRQYFKDNHDNTENGGPSALATVRLFKALKRGRELGKDIREEALIQARHPKEDSSFEAKAEGVISVLHKHGILAGVEGTHLDREERLFIKEVRERAEKGTQKPAEIMYRTSASTVYVWSRIRNGEVVIDNMRLSREPYSNPVDGDLLAEDLGRVFNRTSYTKDVNFGPDQTPKTRTISEEER